MATAKWSPKDPQDVRDYWIDFSSLLADDEMISAATVAIDPDQHPTSGGFVDLSLDDDEFVGQQVRIRVSGGMPPTVEGADPTAYIVDYHVTTTTGQEFDLSKTLKVRERAA
jgi:hypothetical protein